jgi:hypothetical protein
MADLKLLLLIINISMISNLIYDINYDHFKNNND